jgi:hypothetical protein
VGIKFPPAFLLFTLPAFLLFTFFSGASEDRVQH